MNMSTMQFDLCKIAVCVSRSGLPRACSADWPWQTAVLPQGRAACYHLRRQTLFRDLQSGHKSAT